MLAPIIPAKTAIKSFRDSGYKSSAGAIAEIIDNAIEAKAKNIKILVFEKNEKIGRGGKRISQIAIVDDGIGMDEEILSTCLQFGNGTKLKSRKGIGRFGMGLPNASISQCQNIKIYTWRKSKSLYTYLDVNEVEKKSQQNINEIQKKELPEYIAKEIKKSKNGTIVVWSDCDRLDVARGVTLYNRMSRDLCRIFRHFLDDDETYGERVNILYKVVGTDFEKLLAANDPLYITKPSNTPGFENNTIMELKSNDKDPREGKIEIAFTNPLTRKPDKSEVLFKFSFIKPQIREKESDQRSELMKHLKRNTGISFVRDGREVDFGNFNYFTAYDTTERWWGCEIRFDPLLDEIFGVTIDKQNVRNMGPLSPEIIRDTEITKEDIEYIPNLKLRLEITKRFTDFRKKYMSLRRQQAEGTRAGTKRSPSIADRIFKKRKVLTRSKAEGQTKSEDQINQEHKIKAKKIEELTGKTYTAEQLRDLIEANKKLEVDIDFEGWDGSQFFATEIIGKTATVKINVNHKFYNKLYVSLAKELDKTNVEIVDFMLMSWARVEDELSVTNVKLDDFVKIKEKWGQILTELLDEQEQLLN